MKCAIRLCGHCQLGPVFICQDGPVFRLGPRRAAAAGAGAVMAAASRSSRSGSSPPATAASSACSTARTSCWRSPARSRSRYFLEASSATVAGPYDLSLVEGSITTPEDAERIQRVRRQSRRLVTIGACATAGGIQALRNFADVEDFLAAVYASPEYVSTLATSTPISEHVHVDYELHGCPIDKLQLLEVISAFLNERRPAIASTASASSASARGNVCVMVAHGTPCLGPVTHAGCGALCPSYHRGCYGCFGPMETPRPEALGPVAREPRDARRSTWCASTAPSTRRRAVRRRARRMTETRTIKTDLLARVEGEGAMYVRIRDGRVDDVQLRIYEPPRFFEAFLRGRGYREPPDITARICGICPIAYQMSACAAIEDACGVEVGPAIRALRRLIYCGEWIESHALHVFMLHAPDFLGYDSAIEMARDHRGIVEQGLQIKKAGNEIIRTVGGREIHPVNVRVGGFYRAPRPRELRALVEPLERARELALETVRFTGGPRAARLRARARVRRALDPGRLSARGRAARLDRRARHRARRVRGALRGGARRALDRAALAAARARRLPVRAARALRAERGEALAAGARGGRRGRASARSAATRSAASWSAASRSSTRSTRRCA